MVHMHVIPVQSNNLINNKIFSHAGKKRDENAFLIAMIQSWESSPNGYRLFTHIDLNHPHVHLARLRTIKGRFYVVLGLMFEILKPKYETYF